jgi:two-component system, NarL family, nitrate/nitrite response regulator NarL
MDTLEQVPSQDERGKPAFADDSAVAVPQRIVLADSQLLFLDTLAFVLRDAGHHVVALADNCVALRRGVALHQPDLCVTDDHLPDGDVLDFVASLHEAEQPCRVVVLTAHNDPALMAAALEAGALGFLHKSRGINVLLDVVRRVAADEVVVEGSFARRRNSEDGSAAVRKLAGYLTDRERECLCMLVAGLDTAGMAARLGVSQTTVRSHVQAVLAKLQVHSRLEAATLAMRHGLCKAQDGQGSSAADKSRTRQSSELISRRGQSSTG